jgi:hypothetical protein
MVQVRFIGGPYDGTSQPLPPVSEGERLNVAGNQAAPPTQSDEPDAGTAIWEDQWHPYIIRWRDGELVAVYEPLEATQD